MSNLWQDLRHGVRRLCIKPGFTLTIVVTLAIGIGASSTIFGVVNAFLFRPTAGLRDPDRLVRLMVHQTALNQMAPLSAADLADYTASTPAFERTAAFRTESMIISDMGEAENVYGIAISPSLLEIIGARVVLGREFLPEEHQAGRNQVALIGHGLWMRRFGGAQDVLGRHIVLNRKTHVIAGVLGSRPGLRGIAWVEPDIVTPFQPDDRENRAKRNLMTIARLRPHASLDEARAQLSAIPRFRMA